MAEALRLYPEDDVRLPRTLGGDLRRMRTDKLNNLLHCQTWDDFKQTKGEILALDEAIVLCEEAERKFG